MDSDVNSLFLLFQKARTRACGFGGNVEFSLSLRLLPDFGDLLPAALQMIEELMVYDDVLNTAVDY